MDSAIITAIAAIGGSIVGAMGSFVNSAINQRFHDRRDLLSAQMARWEALYSDFISESARLLVHALQHDVVDPQSLTPIYALVSRIRLNSSSEVLKAAETVLQTILDTYPRPNLPSEEIRIGKIHGEEQLRTFSEICRRELQLAKKNF